MECLAVLYLKAVPQDPLWASDGDEVEENARKLSAAPRTSDEFMLMPSFTTAAEPGQRSPIPDITSQPRSPAIGLQVRPLACTFHQGLPCLMLQVVE